MSDISQQSVVVSGSIETANVVVTVSNARGAEGPQGPSGASTWDEITGTASSIPFEPVTPPAHAEGLVFYDEDDRSLSYYNDEADVAMNIGREMWVRVRNDSGATITNGKVVYINNAQGQLPTIRLARADAEATSRVIGIATHDIENNSNGYVTTSGMVKGLNTSAFQDGDLLFLSAATAGEMTTTAPTAPNRAVQVAIVAHAHVSQGKLYCHPENDSVASTGIVDSTSTGRSILTAANAAAARTAIGSGATGDALFTAATPAAARTTLGVLSATATGTTATTSTPVDVVSITIPSAGFWRIEVICSVNNASSSSMQMSLLFDSSAVIPSTTYRIGSAQVVGTVTALTASSATLVANVGATNSLGGDLNANAYGMIRTTGASVVTLRIANTAGTGTATLTQGALIATQL